MGSREVDEFLEEDWEGVDEESEESFEEDSDDFKALLKEAAKVKKNKKVGGCFKRSRDEGKDNRK